MLIILDEQVVCHEVVAFFYFGATIEAVSIISPSFFKSPLPQIPSPMPSNIRNETILTRDARFEAMFHDAAVGIGIMDFDHRVMDVNPAACRMLGRTQEELKNTLFSEVVFPEDLQSDRGMVQRLLSGEQPSYQVERRYIRKDGGVFWGRATISLVRDLNDQPQFLVGMLEDIDEHRQILAELGESEARFRATFENSAIGIGLLSLDGRILRANEAVCRISGYTEEELKQRSDRENVYPEDWEIDRDLAQELITGKRDSYQIEKRYARKNGQVFWARLCLSLVRDSTGKPSYLVGLIEDIDEHVRMLEELRLSEARFRAVFANASVGMALMTLDRRVVAMNQAVERIIGYTLEELGAMDVGDLVFPEDREIGKDLFTEMKAGKRSGFQMERRYLRKDGRVIWVRISYSFVPDLKGQPQYLIGLIEDIDEQKRIDEKMMAREAEYRRTLELRVDERTYALAEANLRLLEEIEQRQRAEEELAAKAAEAAVTSERNRLARDLHDAVTQTLFSASLIAEVLPDLWQLDPEAARDTTAELRQLTRGALAEMRTLLLELRPAALTQTRFRDLLKQLTEALVGRSRLPIELTVDGERTLPPDVQVALYRIAQESLNNIVKYARAAKVVIHLVFSTAGVYMEIVDDGVGFDPLEIKPASLGMRIMRERAEVIGAELNIESQRGQGTRVTASWVAPEFHEVKNG